MKIALAVLLTLSPTTLIAQAARIETAGSEPRIVVTSTRTSRIAPDRVALYITVEGSGESPAAATQRAAQKLESVRSALRPFAGSTEAVTSIPYGVAPAPNMPGYPGASSQTSYLARHVVRMHSSNLDQLSSLSAAAISAGASTVIPSAFESRAVDSVRRTRHREALAQARSDAESLAAALGGKLGQIIEVSSTEGPSQAESQNFFRFMSNYDFSGPIQQPDVLVRATVAVRYRFIP